MKSRAESVEMTMGAVQGELAELRAKQDGQFEDLSAKMDVLLKAFSTGPRSPMGKEVLGTSDSTSPGPHHTGCSSGADQEHFRQPEFRPRKIELPYGG